MSDEKIYYYMKTESNYFDLKLQKALRNQSNGAIMTIIYLKMQLRYLAAKGYFAFTGLYPTIEEELAVDIDENAVDVRMTLSYLSRYDVIQQISENEYFIAEMQHRIGSKTDVAIRVAKYREKKKLLVVDS